MSHNRRPLFAFIAVVLTVFAAACTDKAARAPGSDWRGATVEPAFEKPTETLLDTSGQPYNIRERTADKVTLLYIGYTHCPDICPTHIHDVATALARVPAEVAQQVTVVFVTADPERDQPAALREWLDLFSTGFVGLIPTQEQLASVLGGLGMKLPEKTDIGNGNYTVSHAAYVIAYTKDGVGVHVYPTGITVSDWIHDLPQLVKVKA